MQFSTLQGAKLGFELTQSDSRAHSLSVFFTFKISFVRYDLLTIKYIHFKCIVLKVRQMYTSVQPHPNQDIDCFYHPEST